MRLKPPALGRDITGSGKLRRDVLRCSPVLVRLCQPTRQGRQLGFGPGVTLLVLAARAAPASPG